MKRETSSQMLKGILQGCLLILLTKKEMYGYKISQELERYGFQDIPKGTIYPLLLNMEKKGLITGKMRPSSDGPKRKYYRISEKGLGEKKMFVSEWQSLANSVDQLIKKDK